MAASLFTRIIAGELPGRFVWKDEHVVAFLTIAPLRPGHVLVVPRREVEHWIDLPDDLAAHLMRVARSVGRAVQAAWSPTRVALLVIGLEVAHVHLHVTPIWTMADTEFRNADPDASAADLDAAAQLLRETLRAHGHGEHVP